MAPGGLVLAFLMVFAGFSSAAQAQQIACPVTTTVAVADGSNNTGGIVIANPITVFNGAIGAPNAAIVNDTVDASILNIGRIVNRFGATWTNSGEAGLGNNGIFNVLSGSTLVNTGAGTQLFNPGPAALPPGVGVGTVGVMDIASSTVINRKRGKTEGTTLQSRHGRA